MELKKTARLNIWALEQLRLVRIILGMQKEEPLRREPPNLPGLILFLFRKDESAPATSDR